MSDENTREPSEATPDPNQPDAHERPADAPETADAATEETPASSADAAEAAEATEATPGAAIAPPAGEHSADTGTTPPDVPLAAAETAPDAAPPGENEQAEPASDEQATAPTGEDASVDAAPAATAAAAKPVRRKPKDPAVARAHRTKLPIEGTVVGVIKGGYEVRLGKSRAFCPHSQIDTVRVEDPESFVDRTLPFLVTQYRRGGEDVVVSRRALLEEERAEEAKAVRATLIEGAVTQGHVVGVAPFGAFVDLGAGVQGLVHISELSHRRVTTVEEAVAVGDTVQVKVLRMEKDGRRISLSVRRAEKDPWAGVGERFPVGTAHEGKVVRLTDFGAFVEMEPGVEALAPAREIPPTSSDWREGLEPGSSRSWRVLSVDRKRRRMSVVPDVEGLPTAPLELASGTTIEGRVQRIERFGVFVWLAPGQVGLMPAPLSGIPQGTRLDSRFRTGDAVKVQVVDVEQGGDRIRLAAEGVDPDAIAADGSRGQGRAPRRGPSRDREAAPTSTSSEDAGTFGSSLGDALRAALGTEDGGKDG